MIFKDIRRGVLAAFLMAAPASAQTLSDFVYANTLHTLLHELGHAIVSEFELPVLGQEEDAVDAFATSEIIQFYDDAEAILSDVALAWLIAHDSLDPKDFYFYDEHDLDAQRAYRTICHLYGADPGAFEDAADWIELPPDYRETCEDTGPLAMDSWNTMLEPHLLDDGAKPREVTLTYAAHPLKDAMQQDGVMEDFQDYAARSFDWPAPLAISVAACGQANAYWDPGARELTLCYEIIEDWQRIEREAVN